MTIMLCLEIIRITDGTEKWANEDHMKCPKDPMYRGINFVSVHVHY